MPDPARFSINDILTATGGQTLTAIGLDTTARIPLSTDTRTVGSDDFFIPLIGANFNAHEFIGQAYQQGIQGALVALSEWETHQGDWGHLPNLIGVPDTLVAYMALAQWHKNHNSHPNLKIIALTGSSGKTTTKDMLFAAFSGSKPTQKTQKNFNNEVGVSQTLLSLQPETELLIVEMGMRGLHQIDILSRCAQPDIALITNVGPAHIELLGSLEAIAQAKLEIVEGLKKDTGILITNGDDPMLEARTPIDWHPGNPNQWRRFSMKDASNIQPTAAEGIAFDYQGHRVTLPVPGTHNIMNAMSVLKTGETLGIPLEKMIGGLAEFGTEGDRWNKQPIGGHQNAWVINDAYNANPDSCKAALSAFLSLSTPNGTHRYVVLAGMKELGPFSDQYHQQLGQWLGQQTPPIQALFTLGDEAVVLAKAAREQNGFPVFHASSVSDLYQHILGNKITIDNSVFFLKGSRFYRLEQLIDYLNQKTAV